MNGFRDYQDEGAAGGHGTGSRHREPIFNIPGIVLSIIAACAIIHALRVYVLDPQTDFAILLRFAFIPARWTGDFGFGIFAVISPFSYAFLHGSIAHLVINSIWLATFGSPLANRLGLRRFVIFWLVTSFLSAVAYFALHAHEVVPVIGASGAISGMMGAAARFGFQTANIGRRRAFAGPVLPLGHVLRSRTVIAFLAVWFAANLLAGTGAFGTAGGASIAWEAHVGGFLAGFFLIPFFLGRKRGAWSGI